MGFVPPHIVPPRGYQPTKKPETLEPPGMFEALLEEIEAGRISAKAAAERYTDCTLARTINPTEADARILRNRAHLNAMMFGWPGEEGREAANNRWLLHGIPDYRPTMKQAEYDTVALLPYPD